MGLIATLGVNDTQHYATSIIASMLKVVMLCHYVQCRYAENNYAYCFMLSVIMLSVIMLSVIMLSVIMLSVIMLSVEAQAIWFKHFSFLTRLGKLECLSLTSISILTLYL
jgi:hypothetical protein